MIATAQFLDVWIVLQHVVQKTEFVPQNGFDCKGKSMTSDGRTDDLTLQTRSFGSVNGGAEMIIHSSDVF